MRQLLVCLSIGAQDGAAERPKGETARRLHYQAGVRGRRSFYPSVSSIVGLTKMRIDGVES